MRKIFYLTILFVMLFAGKNIANDQLIVASNAWTAAYVMEAGYMNVKVLAPAEMLHPSEYELSVEDILTIKKADWVIVAGYELLVKHINRNSFIDASKLLTIKTGYSYNDIEQSVLGIAQKLKTGDKAKKNLAVLKRKMLFYRKEFEQNGWDKVPVLVHFFQQSIAEELGLSVGRVFGPGAPEAFEIADIMHTEFKLIIDNLHNPVGQAIERSSSNLRRIELLNFPGMKNTKGLLDVIDYNVRILKEAMKRLETD